MPPDAVQKYHRLRLLVHKQIVWASSGALASTETHSLAASPYAGQRSVVNCVLSLYYLAVLFYLANFNKKNLGKMF